MTTGRNEKAIRQATVIGGLVGLTVALSITAGSRLVGNVLSEHMTQRTALGLLFLAQAVLPLGALLLLDAAGASAETMVLVVMLLLCAGAYVGARIVMHFDSADGRDR